MPFITVNVNDETYADLKDIADGEGLEIEQYIKKLLEEEMWEEEGEE